MELHRDRITKVFVDGNKVTGVAEQEQVTDRIKVEGKHYNVISTLEVKPNEGEKVEPVDENLAERLKDSEGKLKLVDLEFSEGQVKEKGKGSASPPDSKSPK